MLECPFDPETRIVSRGAAPPVLERGCDICVVGSGASQPVSSGAVLIDLEH